VEAASHCTYWNPHQLPVRKPAWALLRDTPQNTVILGLSFSTLGSLKSKSPFPSPKLGYRLSIDTLLERNLF